MTGLIDVVAPGVQTTVQDLPGRTGYWAVGVPPSGAWDDLSFTLANLALGNPRGAAGLESVLRGPTLRFAAPRRFCLAGAVGAATLDGEPITAGRPVAARAGQVLDLGPATVPRGGRRGLRQYLTVAGGLAVPAVLGSAATFLLGGLGGYQGRALRAGDTLAAGAAPDRTGPDVDDLLPELTSRWDLRVIPGPHGDYLTAAGAEDFFAAEWRVDHRADRTGIRLVGPTPGFSRTDGGEAGLHPSNIHDSAYPVGGIMLSGGTPVIVGPDGPSLGGFVVAAAVIGADLWQLAQLRPGDTVRLVPVAPGQAERAAAHRAELLAAVARRRPTPAAPALVGVGWRMPAPLARVPANADRPALTVRYSGDRHVLVEVGPPRLDLGVRLRVRLLARAIDGAGISESVEGVRSLLLGLDGATPREVAERVCAAWATLPDPATVSLPVREVTLPISFDDPAAHEAMRRYETGVRPDAPWCPDNVEFIRRVNGLSSRQEVFDIVQNATYLVVGLGDVYLGAPVAVPLDPQHRLVTTKYDPPRTWTPENAVGIGGVYLCVYGMEGPGGYQMVGRTVPVWRTPPPGTPDEPPWLLRPFDLLRFTPVTTVELLELRAAIRRGERGLRTRPATLTWADLIAEPVATEFTGRREAAFAAERARWALDAAGRP